MPELRQCPFCGTSHAVLRESGNGKYYVMCCTCEVKTREYAHPEQACNRWNDHAEDRQDFRQHRDTEQGTDVLKVYVRNGEVRLHKFGSNGAWTWGKRLKRYPYCDTDPSVIFDATGEHWHISCPNTHYNNGAALGKPGFYRTFIEAYEAWQKWR